MNTKNSAQLAKGLKVLRSAILAALCRVHLDLSGVLLGLSIIKFPEVKESKRHCRLFKAKSSQCFYEIKLSPWPHTTKQGLLLAK